MYYSVKINFVNLRPFNKTVHPVLDSCKVIDLSAVMSF